MKKICYNHQTLEALDEDKSVLDCLLRHQIPIPHGCKSGVCQSCVLKKLHQPADPRAQQGLEEHQITQNLFLSCQHPIQDKMEVASALEAIFMTDATIHQQRFLSQTVMELTLLLDQPLKCFPGQFVRLIREVNGEERPLSVIRSYSVAEIDQDLKKIKLHIRKIPQGKMTSWLFECSQLGKKIKVSGPAGRLYYREEFKDQHLILVGTGTGLAPLYGVIQSARQNNFNHRLSLYHGALHPQGLYLVDELIKLSKNYPRLDYYPCVKELNHSTEEYFLSGDLMEQLNKIDIDVSRTVVFLCGDPQMVKTLKTNFFLKGVPSHKIYSDPFLPSIG